MGLFKQLRYRLRKTNHDLQLHKLTPLSETPFSSSISSDKSIQIRPKRSSKNFLKHGGRAIGRHIRIKLNLLDPTDLGGEALTLKPPSPPEENAKPTRQPSKKETFDTRYKELRQIAEGGNGIVNLCKDIHTSTLVAVKTIPRSHSTRNRPEPSEVRILRELGEHANIVRLLGCLDSPTDPLEQKIVFEYCSMGDLTDYCGMLEDGIPECFIWSVFRQVGDALAVLHGQGIVHGDLKMSNVLVAPPVPGSSSPYPLLKVADFGTSKTRPQRWVPRAHLGTWDYMPPDSTEVFGPETDMWCLGVILHVLALGVEPIQEVEVEEKDVEKWFYRRWSFVPRGTPNPQDFKLFAYWQACHRYVPLRIDRGRVHACYKTEAYYSNALNWFMMRCLDLDWRKRICAFEVQKSVGKLDGFVRRVFMKGHEDLLDEFDDGRDEKGRLVANLQDAEVVSQLCVAVCDRAVSWRDAGLLEIVEDFQETLGV
ncbi:kinase-like protein [Lophiostoma macrostomum CBS 122681]|uniref:Kinase-like protein n=1 Tax=Lophiostoma macrostomum CBS 122681 TaxID=1314788 RepID=A0A6A6SWS1_9PLEO|nr:kinase-like protein [Lophiostoma macrostomum CBS 122681]